MLENPTYAWEILTNVWEIATNENAWQNRIGHSIATVVAYKWQ